MDCGKKGGHAIEPLQFCRRNAWHSLDFTIPLPASSSLGFSRLCNSKWLQTNRWIYTTIRFCTRSSFFCVLQLVYVRVCVCVCTCVAYCLFMPPPSPVAFLQMWKAQCFRLCNPMSTFILHATLEVYVPLRVWTGL